MKTIMLFAVVLFGVTFSMAQIKVSNLRTENQVNPVGLDMTAPRFSWTLLSAKRNVKQKYSMEFR